MDPNANLLEQVKLCTEIVTKLESHAAFGSRSLEEMAMRLAELALALHEWRMAGGYDPYALADEGKVPTNKQAMALGRFLRGFFNGKDPAERAAHVSRGGAGLPDDYVYVRLPSGYEGGIDKDGRVST